MSIDALARGLPKRRILEAASGLGVDFGTASYRRDDGVWQGNTVAWTPPQDGDIVVAAAGQDVNGYLYNPHQYKTPGKLHDGEELWQQLVRKHDFLLTLNGHVLGDGTGYLASRNDRGHTCHQMLANYQMRELGGEGYLRLLEFRPDGKTVVVKTYSPLYESWLLEPDQQFRFELDDR